MHTLVNILLVIFMYVYVERMNGSERNEANNVSEQVNVRAAVIPTKIYTIQTDFAI